MAAIMSSSGGLEAMLSRYLSSPRFEGTFLVVPCRKLLLHHVPVNNFDRLVCLMALSCQSSYICSSISLKWD